MRWTSLGTIILLSTNQEKDERYSEDNEGMWTTQLFHIMETHMHNGIGCSTVKANKSNEESRKDTVLRMSKHPTKN